MSGTLKPLLMARTDFSLGESTLSPKKLVEIAKEAGHDHVVVADTMNIAALIPTTQAGGEDVQAIVGTTLNIVDDPELRDRKLHKRQSRIMPKVFARSYSGMERIFSMLSRGFEEDRFYFSPRLGMSDLSLDLGHPDIIVTTGDFDGVFSQPNWRDWIEALLQNVSADRLYVELVPIPTMLYDRINSQALEAISEYKLRPLVTHPLVMDGDLQAFITNRGITNRSDYTREFTVSRPHYERLSPVSVQDVIDLCTSAKERIALRYPHVTQDGVWKQGLLNAQAFRSDAAFRWSEQPVSLPSLSSDPDEAVKQACKEGLKKRISQSVFGYQPTPDEVRERYIPRLKYELDVLSKMGFNDYFLVVADLVNWSKSKNILVGPGRGSVGGSLVAYLMGITDVDPMRFDLLFERFINPSRNDLPDADLDFMSTRREEVVRYLERKYGRDRVAGISNYTALGSSSAIRDVARVYGMNPETITASKLVPKVHGQPVDLEEARQQVADIDMFAEQNPAIWRDALALQGVMRSFGKHAAGVIVAGVPLVTRAVIERRSSQRTVNWDMSVVEKMGLVKLDILGLSTLDTIARTLDYIEQRHGSRPALSDIDLEDEQTLAAFSRGETIGVFQFEGGAARRILKDMAKTTRLTFDDIVAANALNRPGPIDAGLVTQYINRRNNDEPIVFPHQKTEEALANTFGVIVYQEQVMRVSVDLCGFSLSDADKLRKAMGKKKPEEMAKWREAFVKGAVDNSGMPEWEAADLFDQIEKFAGYAFNKSHAVEYSLISFQTMWLKTHYPVEFYAGALSTVGEDKLQKIVEDAVTKGIHVLPPDINLSGHDFVIADDTTLVTPFSRVKGVSAKTTDAILEARKNGPFASIDDLRGRVPARQCNSRHIEHLDKVGAFTKIEPDQLGPLDLTRLRDQIILMPGLTTRPLPAARACQTGKKAILTLADVIERVKAADEDAEQAIPVIGKHAKMAIVADCPGYSEIQSGKFGKGQQANYTLLAMQENDIRLADVYWTGVLKRAKEGKMISQAELKLYAPFLKEEMDAVKPPVIIALGSNAARFFFPDLKGSVLDIAGQTIFHPGYDATVVIGFNPSMVYHDPDKMPLLVDIFATARAISRY